MHAEEKLVTLARRYCMEHYRHWSTIYAKRRAQIKSNSYKLERKDYDIFPRYQELEKILYGVESLVGKMFLDIDDCMAQLKEAVCYHSIYKPELTTDPRAKKAILEEETNYLLYLDSIDMAHIDEQFVMPLPYVRRLNDDQALEIRRRLQANYQFNGNAWIPLVKIDHIRNLAFDVAEITPYKSALIKAIQSMMDDTFYQIDESGSHYEKSKSEFDLTSVETVWCALDFEWMIYRSHEKTIAFSGGNLLSAVQKIMK
ncbi:hypothetical protein [Listeria ilorinensis]|uniref:hypothetical protein n=1 Tax=Listeria ilorinensis TaxID=2867439 RepID=UPI001EF53B1B|nr:hypothetical protein [Listeria ilorinensis]